MNPQKNRKRKNHKVRSVQINKTVALLVLFCLCIGGISMASAKYIKQTDTKNNSVAAKEFYFESDLLDGTNHEIIPTENNGTTASVTIRLMNYVDELRYSGTEIQYNVTVSVADRESTTPADNVTISPASGTIPTDGKYEQDVKLSNLEAGKTYLVTATTDNIYKKTLTGTIKVAEADTTVHASLRTTDQYIEVTIWTTDYAGPITLKYGSNTGLVPDNTDPLVSGKTTGEDINISADAWGTNTSHVFRFFKTADAAGKTYQAAVNGTEVTVSAQ